MLLHQRLGHLHHRGISDIHNAVDGIPKIKHHCIVDKCPTCTQTKMHKNPVGHGNLRADAKCVGMGLSLDWVFVFQKSTNDDRVQKLTGVDCSQAYLLAFDHFSDHIWGISARSKSPPLTWINRLLTRISPDVQGKYVTMDLGGELGRNKEFQQIFLKHGYEIRPTTPNASNENALVKRPHHTI